MNTKQNVTDEQKYALAQVQAVALSDKVMYEQCAADLKAEKHFILAEQYTGAREAAHMVHHQPSLMVSGNWTAQAQADYERNTADMWQKGFYMANRKLQNVYDEIVK